jgi:multisubunit Na+/H+ antiporter MnhF subunit
MRLLAFVCVSMSRLLYRKQMVKDVIATSTMVTKIPCIVSNSR